MSKDSKRERITIRLNKRYMQLLNELIDGGAYNSRNEAIRDALRMLFEHHSLRVLVDA
jgi:Arc/MetJ-type ribon-helix-helix transcriptional regulator